VLVCIVAVVWLEVGHVRRAVEDFDAPLGRVLKGDWVALVAGQPVNAAEARLMAKEMVKGAILLVEHHHVLDPRVCTRERAEQREAAATQH